MSNLFRIDFLMSDTSASDYGQTKHSLVDTASNRLVVSLTLSADKLTSVSNYTREPKRLVFECFPDAWLTANLMSGTQEFERYISKYEVKSYRDGTLIFTGIIDTSLLSYDYASQILKITCYDKIRLFSIYSDIEQYFSLTSGYQPGWMIAYFIQNIQQRIPVAIGQSNQFTLPALAQNDLNLCAVNYQDMEQVPANSGGWVFSIQATSWTYPKYGYLFDSTANTVTFCFAHKKIIQAHYSNPAQDQYRGRFRARIWKFFNGICPLFYDYDENTDWKAALTDLDDDYNNMLAFFTDHGIGTASLDSLASCGALNGNGYNSGHTVHVGVSSSFTGNALPSVLHPGRAYETLKDDKTENLKALQAMLMLYNATIYADPSGNIVFRNKNAYNSAIIDIADADVISLATKRGNQERPDMSVLETLCGDTTKLKSLLQPTLVDFYDGKWEIEATIDSLTIYSIGLFSKIRIRGVTYAVTEITRDFQNDEYKLKAWQL
jgi:hypothetical protein